jgi:hypothetical protein
LQQQLQQAMGLIQQLQQKTKDKETGHMVALQKTREINQTTLAKTAMQEENENKRSLATHMRALMEAENMPKKSK